MRIDPAGSASIGGANNTGQSQGVGGGHSNNGGQTPLDHDQVDLSGASSLVALSAGIVSPARQQKIAALTNQVQNGSYTVDPARVASAIVDNMLRA